MSTLERAFPISALQRLVKTAGVPKFIKERMVWLNTVQSKSLRAETFCEYYIKILMLLAKLKILNY